MKLKQFKSINFMKELLDSICTEIDTRNSNAVVWLGVHEWLPIVLNVIIDKGIEKIAIIDNDKNKWGTSIATYTNMKKLQKEFVVVGMEALEHHEKNTIFFLANTHFDEFAEQLSHLGIEKENIINLYEKTLIEKKFVKEEKCFALKEGYELIQGRTLQLTQYSILKEFKKICKELGLTYWLGGGTLLGAVRHHGFIPWDDDIDVYMPFADYLRLIMQFPSNSNYALLNWRIEENCAMNFTKMIDCHTYLIHDKWFPYLYIMGCYIDIFPLGGYPKEQYLIEQKWNQDQNRDQEWNYYYLMKDIKECDDCREKIVKEKFSIPFHTAKMVGAMHRILQKRWAVKSEVFSQTIPILFEDEYFNAPVGYGEYLITRYGNYMEIPSRKEQIMHSFPTYRIVSKL